MKKFLLVIILFMSILIFSNLESKQKFFASGETDDYFDNVEMIDYGRIGYVNDEILEYERTVSMQSIGNETNYIVFPDDESTGFDNFTNVSLNTLIEGVYNDRGDYDYYKLQSSSTNRIVKFDIDQSSYLSIYLMCNFDDADSYYKYYDYRPISNQYYIYIPLNFDAMFVITHSSNYTGEYSFEIDEQTITDYNMLYLKAVYNNNSFKKFEVIYNDYSQMPSSATKNGLIPSNLLTGYDLDGYASNSSRAYFEMDINTLDTVFDSNNQRSIDHNDDQRKFDNYNRYPALSVIYLKTRDIISQRDINNGNSVQDIKPNAYGTAFLIDDGLALTAGHMVDKSKNYYDNSNDLLGVRNAFNLTLAGYVQPYTLNENDYFSYNYDDLTILSSRLLTPKNVIYPLMYFIDRSASNDWSIIEFNESTLDYGYLGLKYNGDSYTSLNVLGYPALHYVPGRHITNRYAIKLTNSNDTFVNYSTNTYKSFIDVTSGNSGGPCIEIDNQNYYARAIVSQGDFNGNYFTKIDARIISLVNFLTGGQ